MDRQFDPIRILFVLLLADSVEFIFQLHKYIHYLRVEVGCLEAKDNF